MRSFKAAVFFLSLSAGPCASCAADRPEQPTPTKSDVSYGPDARNVLDFWDATGDGPRPLLIYIHGGGWLTGDKSKKGPAFQPFLDRGISIAAINYRLTPENPLPAPVYDAARAMFLRSKANQWNIDTKHIALTGPSAGGCTAMWLLLHDDIAVPLSNRYVREHRAILVSVDGETATLRFPNGATLANVPLRDLVDDSGYWKP